MRIRKNSAPFWKPFTLDFFQQPWLPPHRGNRSRALAAIVPLVADRPARDDRTTLYVCENFACQEPVTGLEGAITALGKLESNFGPAR